MEDAEERWDNLVIAAKSMKDLITRDPNGSHTIPGLSMAHADKKTLYDINYLIPLLRETYPDFTFWKSETLFDNEGLKINWKYTPGLTGEQAVNQIRDEKHNQLIAIEREQELKELEYYGTEDTIPEN